MSPNALVAKRVSRIALQEKVLEEAHILKAEERYLVLGLRVESSS